MIQIKNIKTKLLLYIMTAFFALYVVVFAIISSNVRNTAQQDAEKILQAKTGEYKTIIEKDLERILESARSMQYTFRTHPNFQRETWEPMFDKIIFSYMEKNPDFLSVGLYWEIKTFDPSYTYRNGRIRNIVLRKGGQIIQEKNEADLYSNEVIENEYYMSRELKEETIWNPYYDVHTKELAGILMTTIISPIMRNGVFEGMVGIDISLETMNDIISRVDAYEQSNSYLLATNLSVVGHTDNSLVGENFMESLGDNADTFHNAIDQVKQNGKALFNFKNDKNENYLVALQEVEIGNIANKWIIGIEVPVNYIMKDARAIFIRTLIIGLIGLIIMFIIVFLIADRIAAPIIKATHFAGQIADGNLNANIEIHSDDEVGQLAQSLKGMSEKLKEIIHDIIQSSELILEASTELISSSNIITQGANDQAASTEEISSTMEEMVSNIEQSSENSNVTRDIAKKAAKGIHDANQSTQITLDAMKNIVGHISIIGEISKQTNILALNAAVEAARAGEYGKGFAVVASEVKKLAERSQEAANEINQLSDKGMKIADDSGIKLEALIPEIERTANLVEEINASGLEQKSGAEQINNALQQLNSVTQQNAGSATMFTENAQSLAKQAEQLKELVAYFK